MKLSPLNIYSHLPYFLKVLTASLRGYYLHSWRYGPETQRLVEEARERESWSLERWKAWQKERIAFILHHAATKVPYYRDQWRERRGRGDRTSFEYLENWPVLYKETLRAAPKLFLAEGSNPHKMWEEHTSGTTGKPLTLWMSREAIRGWYALVQARWRGWYDLSRHDKWAILGGQLVTPYAQTKPPFWVWNAGLNQLYMSSYHLSPGNIKAYLEALRQHRVVYGYGYASSLFSLGGLALEQGLKIPRLKIMISNAEPLYAHQRAVISDAFQCPVVDTYGLSENVCAASECSAGNLHLWPDVGVLEVMSDDVDEPLPSGRSGRLICTALLNPDMPLIRYETGDRGTLAPDWTECSCGRSLPILQSIEGRIDDVILTSDGRRIGRLDPVFKADLPLREAQIIQENLGQIRVRFVPAQTYHPTHGNILVQRLRQRLGDMQIVLEPVKAIPRSENGKFRAVLSQLSESTSTPAKEGT